MIQVKIIKNRKTELLERDINDFLQIVGTQHGIYVDIKDIKITQGDVGVIATIIYSIKESPKNNA